MLRVSWFLGVQSVDFEGLEQHVIRVLILLRHQKFKSELYNKDLHYFNLRQYIFYV